MSFINSLEEVFNSITIPTLLSDFEGNVVYVNSAFTKITGYTSEDVLNKKIGKISGILYSGYHSDNFYKKLWDTINNGYMYVNEVKNKRKDGTMYWEQLTIQPIKDKYNGRDYFIANLLDITKVRETKLKLEAVVEAVSKDFIITIHDRNRNLMEVIGEEYNTFLPVTISNYIGKSFRDLEIFNETNLKEIEDSFDQVDADPTKSYIKELTVECDGKKIILECATRRFNSSSYIKICKDVTSSRDFLKMQLGLNGLEEQINKLIKSRSELKRIT